ncbi:type I polyketide synthase [Geobacter sp. AOG1]|uniref:type I polyketide synthase n=1 Tax=Geobacter sp. AOG1 TaxID=1566346 RepID=UPI001CC78978|nr:type I polyketide synthase [Geobacter sp. AOG1]
MEEGKPEITTGGSPLAIIGIGCLFPGAEDQSTYWANIREGIDAITDIPSTHWRTTDYHDPDPKTADHTYGKRGGFLSPFPFNPIEFNIPPNTMEAIDTSQLLGLVATGQALKDAGYGPEKEFDRNRVSVILGVTGTLELVIPLGARLGHPIWKKAMKDAGVDDAVAEDAVQRISDSYVSWQENSFPGLLGNVVAGRISKQYDLGGTNCVVDAACASSLSALHLASMELDSGKVDMVVTGGVDTFNDIFMYMCFSKTPALSPSGNAKPFDASGDGTILGEGLGIVVIKRLADAERDGDRIYAVIRGIGSSSDGKGDAIYAPSAAGQKKALLNAYRQADVTPESIELIEAHGTGTKVGDAVEVSALRQVYGEADTPWCALGSVKSQIGHTKAAAGAAGLIKAALALHHKVIPPTIKVEKPLDEVTSGPTPFYIPTEKRPWLPRAGGPRRAAVSAFGFGGSNFHTVLEEYRPKKDTVDWDGDTQIFPFSGADVSTLETAVGALPADMPWKELRGRAAAARATFDGSAPCRLALVVERDRTNLTGLCANAQAMLRKNAAERWNTPDGAYFSRTMPCKLGMVFPGQGSQYTGMLRDLACRFPQMIDSLTAADAGLVFSDGMRLSDRIYPIPAFDPAARERQEEVLRATEAAQPAIGAVSLGALRILESFGLAPEAVAGHSYGELTALCAGGRFDESALHGLSRLRGRLMGAGAGDKGGMLAVPAPLATIEQILAEEKIDLVIANRNAPAQAVLSGSSAEIDRAATIFAARKLTCKRLPVAAAFHSALVADAAAPFLTELADIDLSPGNLPVYANTTAAPYPADPAAAKELLAGQLARPVEFVAEIEAMYAAGIRTFVEVGPGARLSGLIDGILGERDHVAVAIDASSGRRAGIADLARALAQLAVLGYGVRLTAWDETYRPPVSSTTKKPAMTIPLCGANYMQPKPARPPVAPKPAVASASPAPHATAPPLAAVPSATSAVPQGMLAESLRVTRESMVLLQKMQEETAMLHRRFLEGQETASRTFQTLLESQRQILMGGIVAPAAPFVPVQPTTMVTPPPVVMPASPPVSEAVPSPVAMPVTAPATSSNRVAETLLAVVSEKTGYPVEMLDLEMGMDADLGIDSIKRVEILSTLQERLPGAPAIGPEHLGSLRTLGEIARHLGAGAAPVAAAVPAPATVNNVAETLLAVVSEKTGYPVEMLDLEMGMDADLGIDSIKRVEILSTLQERLPGAPAIGPEHLGSLRTLGEIARHLGAGAAPVAAAVPAPATVNNVAETLLAVVSEKTGYPVEMLDLEMGMDADLGIDSIKRVEILSTLQERLPGAPAIGPEHLGSLRTLGEIARHLGAGAAPASEPSSLPVTPVADTGVPADAAKPALSVSPIGRSTIVPVPLDTNDSTISVAAGGEFWVVDDGSPFTTELCAILRDRGVTSRLVSTHEQSLHSPALLSGLVVTAPFLGTDDLFLEEAFLLLQGAAPALRQAGTAGGALFATISRLDGAFGAAPDGQLSDPLSGGLAGLAKTASHEWPEVACRAIDLGQFADPAAAACAVADELFRSGPLEVGLTPEGRSTLALTNLPAAPVPSAIPVDKGDLVVITGGGRGVTAAAAIAFAEACQPVLLILGRSAAPSTEPEWLLNLTEEPRIKRAILEQAGGKLHPREIEERFRTVIAGRELSATMARIEAAGGRALYRSVDIRDGAAVGAVIEEIRREYGPVRGIVHGAGVLADRLIVDKSREQFTAVYGTKVDGLRALLAATRDDSLRFIALFSSTTGRFGRTGQVDYAVANEVLNKLAQVEMRRRPACRTVSINWGPWDGGMVTPALKKVFTGEGIGLIGLAEGGDFLVREIAASDGPVEVVALATAPGSPATVQTAVRSKNLTEALTLTLTVDDYPFLRSHVLDGKAVLPMAVIVEWLAHGALHGNPGFRFHGFNDLRICKGVVFDQSTPCTIQLMAGRAEKRESFHLVPVELHSTGKNGQTVLNARAEIVLATRLTEGIRSIIELPTTPYALHNGKLYDRERLFHGPDLHGIEQVDGCSAKGIAASVKIAPPPSSWMKHPLRSAWLTDPLVIDSAFQLMILWSFERFGAGSLPCYAGRYRQFQEAFPEEGVQVVIRVTAEREHGATADMEFLDRHSGKLVARLEGYECVIDPSLERAFQRNQLSQERGAA